MGTGIAQTVGEKARVTRRIREPRQAWQEEFGPPQEPDCGLYRCSAAASSTCLDVSSLCFAQVGFLVWPMQTEIPYRVWESRRTCIGSGQPASILPHASAEVQKVFVPDEAGSAGCMRYALQAFELVGSSRKPSQVFRQLSRVIHDILLWELTQTFSHMFALESTLLLWLGPARKPLHPSKAFINTLAWPNVARWLPSLVLLQEISVGCEHSGHLQ